MCLICLIIVYAPPYSTTLKSWNLNPRARPCLLCSPFGLGPLALAHALHCPPLGGLRSASSAQPLGHGAACRRLAGPPPPHQRKPLGWSTPFGPLARCLCPHPYARSPCSVSIRLSLLWSQPPTSCASLPTRSMSHGRPMEAQCGYCNIWGNGQALQGGRHSRPSNSIQG